MFIHFLKRLTASLLIVSFSIPTWAHNTPDGNEPNFRLASPGPILSDSNVAQALPAEAAQAVQPANGNEGRRLARAAEEPQAAVNKRERPTPEAGDDEAQEQPAAQKQQRTVDSPVVVMSPGKGEASQSQPVLVAEPSSGSAPGRLMLPEKEEAVTVEGMNMQPNQDAVRSLDLMLLDDTVPPVPQPACSLTNITDDACQIPPPKMAPPPHKGVEGGVFKPVPPGVLYWLIDQCSQTLSRSDYVKLFGSCHLMRKTILFHWYKFMVQVVKPNSCLHQVMNFYGRCRMYAQAPSLAYFPYGADYHRREMRIDFFRFFDLFDVMRQAPPTLIDGMYVLHHNGAYFKTKTISRGTVLTYEQAENKKVGLVSLNEGVQDSIFTRHFKGSREPMNNKIQHYRGLSFFPMVNRKRYPEIPILLFDREYHAAVDNYRLHKNTPKQRLERDIRSKLRDYLGAAAIFGDGQSPLTVPHARDWRAAILNASLNLDERKRLPVDDSGQTVLSTYPSFSKLKVAYANYILADLSQAINVGIPYLERALSEGGSLLPAAERFKAFVSLGCAYFFRGSMDDGRAQMRTAIDMGEIDPSEKRLAHFLLARYYPKHKLATPPGAQKVFDYYNKALENNGGHHLPVGLRMEAMHKIATMHQDSAVPDTSMETAIEFHVDILSQEYRQDDGLQKWVKPCHYDCKAFSALNLAYIYNCQAFRNDTLAAMYFHQALMNLEAARCLKSRPENVRAHLLIGTMYNTGAWEHGVNHAQAVKYLSKYIRIAEFSVARQAHVYDYLIGSYENIIRSFLLGVKDLDLEEDPKKCLVALDKLRHNLGHHLNP